MDELQVDTKELESKEKQLSLFGAANMRKF